MNAAVLGVVADSNLKHIFLLSTWQNNIYFNDTFFIKFAGKCSGPHTKITNGVVFTEFFTIKRIRIILLRLPIHKKRTFFILKYRVRHLNLEISKPAEIIAQHS
jgi:hypothetical protein